LTQSGHSRSTIAAVHLDPEPHFACRNSLLQLGHSKADRIALADANLFTGNIHILKSSPSFDYDVSEGVRAQREVPMLRVFGSFDGAEILMLAAASLLVIGITFLF
jgi:hypothetical protein